MSEIFLQEEANLLLTLAGIRFPSNDTAEVEFSISPTEPAPGAIATERLELTVAVPHYRIPNSDTPDHNRIVETAATRLKEQFKSLISSLKSTYTAA